MNLKNKSVDSYKTIGETAKELGLINSKTGQIQTHTLRYWETQFKQIKPFVGAGRRRYYSRKSFEVIKSIKYLLKQKGLTINGVKKILNNPETHSIDPSIVSSIYRPTLKVTKDIKKRLKKISKIIGEIKRLK